VSTGRSTTVRDQHRRAIARTKPPCGICEDEIDYTLRLPHPMSYEVDHIIAIDNGGPDTLDNKQASHRVCNREKWNKTADEIEPQTFVTHRTW
jgi:5-methylcytosine-specific restriction endonuclease McrA